MTTENTQEAPDRRDVIEAAFEAAEKTIIEPVSAETLASAKTRTEDVKGAPVASGPEGLNTTTPAEKIAPDDANGSKSLQSKDDGVKDEKAYPVDKAPQSWKPAQQAKWNALDPDIRQEVIRRERETTRVLSDSTQARQFTQAFQQATQPYMARIQSLNAHPISAVQELLKSDHILSTAPKAQRAQFMAKLISDYGVDIAELDAALSGKTPVNPVESQVEQLVQQRLAPFQQFMQQQEQARLEQGRQQSQEAAATVESMAADTAKYPFFEQVRSTMADIVEFNAARNRTVTIETAYNQAVAMDQTLSQELASKQAQASAAVQAQKLNELAQRALKASTQVGGAPVGSVGGSPAANSRRAAIEAAIENAGGM